MNSSLDVAAGQVTRDFDINPYSYALNTSRTLDPNTDYVANYAPFNILRELDNNFIELNVVDVKFQGCLLYTSSLNLRSRIPIYDRMMYHRLFSD